MSDENNESLNEWVHQGFFGPKEDVVAAKVLVDNDKRVGAWIPPQGAPPITVDVAGTQAMFAVLTRRENPVPVPPGLMEANPFMVGRMVGG